MQDNNQTTTTTPTLDELGGTTPVRQKWYNCKWPGCTRSFTTETGRATHVTRIHEKRHWISNPTGSKGRAMTLAEKKRARKAAQREAFRQQGLSTRGTPLINPDHYTRRNKPGFAKGKKWSAAHRAKYMATVARKKQETSQGNKQVAFADVANVVFCPRCGCNIKAVALAISMGDKQ